MTQKILKRQLFSQAKEFFFPAKSIATKEKNNSGSGQLQPLLMMLILSIMGGLGVFMYTQSQLHLFTGQTPPYLFIALYIGIWILYFVFKNLFYYFVDWIFFDKSKRENWQKSYFFLLAIETLLFFPVIISTIYLNLPTHTPLWIVLTIGLLVKILLLYKTFQIFFPKIYGTLHLIVYFCTLEIMPLLVIFKVLIRVTEELIVKF
ncbi:MAG: DUF4271 domain-containing protein [Bacteroidaceae bacterium]|nr:DUF4271 domain-containing protein [Bacteroidaceae bacterium]